MYLAAYNQSFSVQIGNSCFLFSLFTLYFCPNDWTNQLLNIAAALNVWLTEKKCPSIIGFIIIRLVGRSFVTYIFTYLYICMYIHVYVTLTCQTEQCCIFVCLNVCFCLVIVDIFATAHFWFWWRHFFCSVRFMRFLLNNWGVNAFFLSMYSVRVHSRIYLQIDIYILKVHIHMYIVVCMYVCASRSLCGNQLLLVMI